MSENYIQWYILLIQKAYLGLNIDALLQCLYCFLKSNMLKTADNYDTYKMFILKFTMVKDAG